MNEQPKQPKKRMTTLIDAFYDMKSLGGAS